MIGRLLGNRYEIIEKIGGGGMALVYKAKCQLLNRYVAVKILRPEFTSDEDFISKFKRESQAAASLSHPNIVNIYDVGEEENDIYYIVMEYVKGKTLKKIIKEKAPFSIDETINIAKQIALALQHAHANHIVHRDIKPHNILVTDDGRVKVTDFGIARAVTSSTVTNTGNVIGSVHYFSPEQARGGYTDEKSDIYSLGIVMYEMSTGRVPFEGESPISVALKHIHEDVTLPTLINPDIPKALEDIILKAIQKDQIKRYNNAKEILEDLNQALRQPSGGFVKFEEDDDCPTQVIPVVKEKDIKTTKTLEPQPVVHKKHNKTLTIIAIAVAFVLALAFTGGLFFKSFFTAQEKEVPNLVGMTYEAAKINIENLGLKAEIASEQYSSSFDAGEIISQEPEAGETVKTGFPIKLTISKGAKLVEVPNLINKSINELEYILSNANLAEGIVKYENNSLPNGVILSQDPEPRKKVPEGTEVNIIVSQGPEIKMFLMPNLVGEDVEAAKKTIETLGLVLGKIDYKFDDNIEKDIVISQSIQPSIQVEENKTVDLTVSKGKENVVQPSEEDELQMKTVPLTIYFNNAKKDEFILKIEVIQNGISTEVYSGMQKKSEGSETIPIQGRGQASVKIYFDDQYVTKKINFETGSLSD
ncbi:MAG: Stk1 family PASTA domain-containing Ser/Thr kinase [Bacillota bacterium]